MKIDTLLKVIPKYLDIIIISDGEMIEFNSLTDTWSSVKAYGECYVKEIFPLSNGIAIEI